MATAKPMEMSQDEIILNEIRKRLENHSIGFLQLNTRAGAEDAICAGSGTLIAVGPVSGILTAAHVITALPERGEVGLLRFPGRVETQQRMKIRMEYLDSVVIGSPPFNEEGPDLGFLKLPSQYIDALEAVGCVFHNVSARRDDVLSRRYPTKNAICCAMGVIHSWTRLLTPLSPNTRRMSFAGLIEPGETEPAPTIRGYDRHVFVPQTDEGYEPPDSYQGMSGGGLWCVSINREAHAPIAGHWLVGVRYHQSDVIDGTRTITCHGREGVYRFLMEDVSAKWPE